ncbi:MAG: hypothetical protein COB15_09515 [Flavobacteriales bacterium]|nr:MAG: hypothetical protein COB15_09515 [Flavobacteriales bacterium]
MNAQVKVDEDSIFKMDYIKVDHTVIAFLQSGKREREIAVKLTEGFNEMYELITTLTESAKDNPKIMESMLGKAIVKKAKEIERKINK